MRLGGRVASAAAIIATGINLEGRREILGLGIGPSEAQEFWVELLRSLLARGLSGVRLAISDSHAGLKAAIARVLGATWQRCRVHFTRDLQACVPRDCAGMVADQLRGRFPKAAALMDEAEDDALAHMAFPAAHRVKIHSTNPLERLNKEVKRRTDVVGIFPNEASIRRLVGAVLMERNDEWLLAQRYMTLETLAEASGAPTPVPKALAV